MIRIITDTTSSLPIPELNDLDIPCLPQIIIFGEDSYRDDTEMNSAQFLERLKSSAALPKTAAPPPALYTPIYREILEKGDKALVITPSAQVSGTTRSATVAAKDFPSDCIRVVDTLTIASGLGSMVKQAKEWAREEQDLDRLAKRVEDMANRENVFFLVDTLEYLYKGGRIGGAQALVGGLLQVKPILTIKKGRAEPVESLRTKRRAQNRVLELVRADCPHSPEAHLTVCHSDNEVEAKSIVAELQQITGISDIPIYELPPAIVVHAGPGTISVSYFVEKREA